MVASLLPWLAVLFMVCGIGIVFGLGMATGWLFMAIGVIPYVFFAFYKYHVETLPVGKGRSVGALMLSVLLGTAFLSRQLWGAISDRIGPASGPRGAAAGPSRIASTASSLT